MRLTEFAMIFPAQFPSACTSIVTRKFLLSRRAILSSFVAFALTMAAGTRSHAQTAPRSAEAPQAPAAPGEPKLPDPGSISGTVVDEAGNPVERATVQFYDGFGMPIRLRTVHTDHAGHFVAYTLHPGEWALYPSKIEDGYADQIYGTGVSPNFHPTHATVQANTETTGLILHLPPKSAILHIEVMDADTNRPLRSMEVDVQSIEPGRQMVSGKEGWVHNRRPAPGNILITPGVVRLTVTSLGYEKWTAGDDSRHFLTLRSGERREFIVKLHSANNGITQREVRTFTTQTPPETPQPAPDPAPPAAPVPAPQP
jgi:hypothetical protein